MVTRRALFGAGALTLLAGCGPPEETEVDAAEVLTRQLRAEQAVFATQQAIGDDDLSIPDNWRSQTLLEGTRSRIVKLQDALSAAGAAVPAPEAGPATASLEVLLAAERRALRVHVEALGELRDPKWSELFGELISGSAAHETALLKLLERPPLPSAFPGQPVA